MFKDLKEYQEITQLYYDSVNISEEQRAINNLIAEAGFTDEEILYFDENFDELWESELGALSEEYIIESYKEQNLTEEQLNEILGASLGIKAAKTAGKMIKKGVKAVVKKVPKGVKTGIKDTLSGVKEVGKKVVQKAKPVLKKVGNVLKKVPGIALPVAAVGGVAAGINKLRKIGKEKRETENKKNETKISPPKPIGGGNAGASTDSGGTAGPQKTETKTETKPDPKPETKADPKPKKMHPIEKKNRARFGDEKVDKLKAKQVDFKKMRSKEMSKDEFIKKYPNSITAQKAKGLRDHAEWDAYDMVLEYLFSTEQVESLEEANYVMMEMDQQTIGEIVKEVKGSLIEEGLAKAAMKLGALAATGYGVKKGAEKLGTMAGSSKKEKKGGLIQKLKDRRDATNKAIESM